MIDNNMKDINNDQADVKELKNGIKWKFNIIKKTTHKRNIAVFCTFFL